MRYGDFRCHRRPGPQEVDAGIYDLGNRGLLPPRSRLWVSRADWATRISATWSTRRSKNMPGRRSAKRSGTGWPRVSGSCRAPSMTTRRSSGLAERWRNSTPSAAPAAITLSTCRSRRTRFPCVRTAAQVGAGRPQDGRWSRVVIEKPFGHDLESAQSSTGVVNPVFPEESVFRIDHYLGKKTVQNVLALRFANQLFDPVWNTLRRPCADHHGRGHRAGWPRGLLRRHRRGTRRDPEPPSSSCWR